MRFGSGKGWIGAVLGVVLLGAIWVVPGATVAEGEPCEGVIEIVNGDFETPAIVPPATSSKLLPGWSGASSAMIYPASSSRFGAESQFVFLARYGDSISQKFSGTDLAGASIVFSVTSVGGGTISFDGVAQEIVEILDKRQYTSHRYTVPADQVLSLTLTLSDSGNKGFSVESITGTYSKPCPTPTSTPTPESGENIELTVTGDPRFPVDGSAALETPGLTYSLDTAPDHGNATVNPDGSFTYTAANSRVTFDQFTVLASNGSVITVNVVLEIDKSIPTEGEVKPGGKKKGDSSNLTSPEPTSTPGVDEGDDGDSCTECD